MSSQPAEMKDQPGLLSCPFCGGQPIIESEPFNSLTGINPPETRSWVVRCRSCAAQGPWFKTEGNAVAGWNRRVDGRAAEARAHLRAILALCQEEFVDIASDQQSNGHLHSCQWTWRRDDCDERCQRWQETTEAARRWLGAE